MDLFAQTTVSGRVIDAENGDPIPFANISIPGTTKGTTTDFDGYYELEISNSTDSIKASYIGFIPRTKVVPENGKLNFQLQPDVIALEEVVVTAGEDPSYPIMRKVIEAKEKNDKRNLEAYEYESYAKIEIDVNKISEKLRQKKVMQEIAIVLDSLDRIAGEDGKPILPVFISESISDFYVKNNPLIKKEVIRKTKITGVGVTDGSFTSQFIGTSFQEYNFYDSWMTIVDKEVVSPLADSWKGYYDYYLIDSMMVDSFFCYQIDFEPKRAQDVAYKGTMWITKDTYALKQIDATIGKAANLNFIEKIKIQQELLPSKEGAWLPKKTRVTIDVDELSSGSAGMLVKFYVSNKNWVVNDPRDPKFYDQAIELKPEYRSFEDDYWEENRHEPLSDAELNVYSMIDTIRNIPIVKTYIDVVETAISGYYQVGKVDIGPYAVLIGVNDLEGFRLRGGFRTNTNFSEKWILGGYLAYGFKDEKFKYNASVRHIFNKERWTFLEGEYGYDVEITGLDKDEISSNPVFYTFNKLGFLRRPYYHRYGNFKFSRQISRSFEQQIAFRYKHFDPEFNFAYYNIYSNEPGVVKEEWTTNEVEITTKFSKDERFVYDGNRRISLGSYKWPTFVLSYTYGIPDFLGGDFEYHKLRFDVSQNLRLGSLGTSRYKLTAGKIFNPLPYPLLEIHLGNESFFYSTAAFNLMNNYEFVSDQFVSFRYSHSFEGLILNRIPLLKKLKWRLLFNANVVYGTLEQDNFDIMAEFTPSGEPVSTFGTFRENKPYAEIGYGVENILKFIRVDFYHRLNYLYNPNVDKFGVKVSFQFIL
ncbi:DUF5686 family protein [Mangrovivirga sp. M17]|uniref:DUF5686 family protein n=1 Tax=Mangrovivirga halotolerans TaxID=2993936 RepID=A0ABT3RRC6_9BACT|nr:DUF5686 and carboxypeptidase-like regulatory domain-containing protein [Mangrovivirga halotolerans]MCX2744347.1 DUF5686 family protein [Mangrovivirga halotolerans]